MCLIFKMGNGISDNYEEISLLFETQFWKVHSARKKEDQMRVSLFHLKIESFQNRKDRDRFVSSCMSSISCIRRLKHPHVLTIYEVNEDLKTFGFSAEPVDAVISQANNFSEDEILYISDQVMKTLQFLHTEAKVLYLGLDLDSVCLTRDLNVKLFGFNYATSFSELPVRPSYGNYELKFGQPSLSFTAPEYFMNQNVDYCADVYSFGCFVASLFNRKEIFNYDSIETFISDEALGKIKLPDGLPNDMCDIISRCIDFQKRKRPTFDEIATSSWFSQLSLKSLNYIDIILTKTQKDKFDFYTSLYKVLNIFSQRILEFKILPIAVKDLISDIRFGMAVLPIVYYIGKNLSKKDFFSKIVIPLYNIIKSIEPQEIGFCNLKNIEILSDHLDKDKQNDIIYPLINESLKSQNKNMREEAIKHLPKIFEIVSEDSIFEGLLPTIIDYINNNNSISTLVLLISSLKDCSNFVNNDRFTMTIIPQFTMLLYRIHNFEIINPIISIVKNINPSINVNMEYIIPMISDILSYDNIDEKYQEPLLEIIEKSLEKLKMERNLEPRALIWKPETTQTETKVIPPVIPSQIKLNQQKIGGVEFPNRTNIINNNSVQQHQEYSNPKAKLYFGKTKPQASSSLMTQPSYNENKQISVKQKQVLGTQPNIQSSQVQNSYSYSKQNTQPNIQSSQVQNSYSYSKQNTQPNIQSSQVQNSYSYSKQNTQPNIQSSPVQSNQGVPQPNQKKANDLFFGMTLSRPKH